MNPNPSSAVDFSNATVNDVFMWHRVLTSLFILVTLMGPGRCCCLAGASKTTPPTKTPVPVKSCCQVPTPAKQTPNEPKQAPVKKCPCEQSKHDVTSTLPAEPSVGGELVSLLKWIDQTTPVGTTPDRLQLTTTSTNTAFVVPKLSGRSLLAVYSVLRC